MKNENGEENHKNKMVDKHASCNQLTNIDPLPVQTLKKGGPAMQLSSCDELENISLGNALKSAIFGLIGTDGRKYLTNKEMASWGKVTTRFTGVQLDKNDLDVWVECLHLAENTTNSYAINIDIYSLLQKLGRDSSEESRLWLKSSIERLDTCVLEIQSGSQKYFGRLVNESIFDQESGGYMLFLNPKIVELFNSDHTLKQVKSGIDLSYFV